VKIRFGVGSGPGSAGAELTALVDRMEELRLDSVWFSELVTAPQVEPVVGMAWTAARTRRLKVGTGVTVLPGRHPVLVAKQLASLAALAPKRILPVFGLQAAREHERAFFPVAGRRGDVFDESMVLLRRLLTEQRVTFSGEFFSVEDVGVGLLPPEPLDLWLGGSAPAGLRRVGRLGDGWLGSFLTPDEAADAVAQIRRAADDAGREVDPETITDDELRAANSLGSVRWTWPQVRRVVERPEVYLLYQSDSPHTATFDVPRDTLTPEQEAQFRSLLTDRGLLPAT